MRSEFITQVFSPDGLLSKHFTSYEYREGQLEMAEAVLHAFENEEHTAIQAGTGLGKTFAYLIPAIIYALNNNCRVVVSTATMNLQNQIVSKDVPSLQQIFQNQLPFKAVIVKGRGNYICRQRLMIFSHEYAQQSLFRQQGDAEQWSAISGLFYDNQFRIGDRDEIPFPVSESLWNDLCADADNCKRSNCPNYDDCYFYQARQQQRDAQILVTNHALFFADLSLRQDASSEGDLVLAQYASVILDEAQSAEDFATDNLTTRVTFTRMRYLCHNTVQLLKTDFEQDVAQAYEGELNAMVEKTGRFFEQFYYRWPNERTVRFREYGDFEDKITDEILQLAEDLNQVSTGASTEEQRQALLILAAGFRKYANDITMIHDLKNDEEYAYWIELGDRQLHNIQLVASPISVAEILKEHLFDKLPVVLTSATLAGELVQRLGLLKAIWLRYDSPFDFPHHARLYIPNDAIEASPQNEAIFANFVVQRVIQLVSLSRGRAFILFTSYKSMQACHQKCVSVLEAQGLTVLIQGSRRREQLLQEFKDKGNAVLFAVNSFWEGVDVPGGALSLVVIVKLPFAVPTEPIQQARVEAINREGRDPFAIYTVPQAALKLKQGFGRLIRSRKDTGVVAILDKRVLTKTYGARFLKDLPPAPLINELNDVACFFKVLEKAEMARSLGKSFAWPEPPPSFRAQQKQSRTSLGSRSVYGQSRQNGSDQGLRTSVSGGSRKNVISSIPDDEMEFDIMPDWDEETVRKPKKAKR